MASLRAFVVLLSGLILAASYYFNDLKSWADPWISRSLTVTLPQGKIVGALHDDEFPKSIEAFMGLAYSLPPTGDRRFKPLESLPASDQTILANKYGPLCPGKPLRSVVGPPPAYSEDCLTVNIFRPAGTTNRQKLPVALHVHGGAFNRGMGHMHDTDSMVAWSEEPLIGINFNYRIGALGFLPSSLTAKQGVLNLGLRDQIFLFDWVKDNIAEFGGDPENITVLGLSAGAHSIGHHLMNLEYDPPFKRAIIESGAATARAIHRYDAAIHEQQFVEFVQKVGCSISEEQKVFQCLRDKPAEDIINTSIAIFDAYNPSLRWAFQPVIDNKIIPRPPMLSWLDGKWHRMPIITGFCHNEATLYVSPTLNTSEGYKDFWKVLLPELSSADQEQISSLYPDPLEVPTSEYVDTRPLGFGSQYKRIEAAYGQYAYVCPVRTTAHFAQDEPVYLYHWALNQTVQGGANHGDNMKYETFSHGARSFSPAQEKLAGMVHAYWTSFITKGDPNALEGRFADRPKWERYNGTQPKTLVLGAGNDERAGGNRDGGLAEVRVDDWAKENCDFWWSKA